MNIEATLFTLLLLCFVVASMLLALGRERRERRGRRPRAAAAAVGGAAIEVKTRRHSADPAALYVVGDSFSIPMYYGLTSPQVGGVLLRGKSITGLVKAADGDQETVLRALREARPRNILFVLGSVDLFMVFYHRAARALKTGARLGPGAPTDFARRVAEDYIALVRHVQAEIRPDAIYLLAPYYSVLGTASFTKNVERRWIEEDGVRAGIIPKGDRLPAALRPFVQRSVRNEMVDVFAARLAEAFAGKDAGVHVLNLNPQVSEGGIIRSEFRIPDKPNDMHLAEKPVLDLVRRYLPREVGP